MNLRPTEAVIDLSAWRNNLAAVRRRVGDVCGILAVIKANAYGHGMVELARASLDAKLVQGFGVATPDEALELRETEGFDSVPILVMGPTLAGDAEPLQKANVAVAIGNIALLRHHFAVAERRGVPPLIHVKVDTGMGRYGFHPDQLTFLDLFRRVPESLEGVMTHLSVSDMGTEDDIAYTNWQLGRFHRVVERVHTLGMRPLIHAANSGGVLRHPTSHHDLVRPGVMLYGAHPNPADGPVDDLEPVMTLRTRVVSIHSHGEGDAISYGRTFHMPAAGRIALLPVGYGDGWPRALGNKGAVLIRGRRLPIVGRVCMDQTLVDVTDLPDVAVGDEAVLIGRQGEERITLEEVALLAGTIAYEITCQIGIRVPRRWVPEVRHAS